MRERDKRHTRHKGDEAEEADEAEEELADIRARRPLLLQTYEREEQPTARPIYTDAPVATAVALTAACAGGDAVCPSDVLA